MTDRAALVNRMAEKIHDSEDLSWCASLDGEGAHSWAACTQKPTYGDAADAALRVVEEQLGTMQARLDNAAFGEDMLRQHIAALEADLRAVAAQVKRQAAYIHEILNHHGDWEACGSTSCDEARVALDRPGVRAARASDT